MFDEFRCALLLSREKGVGAKGFKTLLEQHKLPSVALHAWQNQQNRHLSKISLDKSNTADKIDNAMAGLQSGAYLAHYYNETAYPSKLASLSEPPPVIFCSGKIKNCPYAAVVGARKATNLAVAATKSLVQTYINKGYEILSGGAEGIDSAAHSEALALGHYTLMIAATGIDIDYPKSNIELFKRIRENGAMLSELMPGTQPSRGFFPTRNRLIAALADIIIIVQASEKSGSLITAKWGLKLGKPVFVLTPLDESENFAGNRWLLNTGKALELKG